MFIQKMKSRIVQSISIFGLLAFASQAQAGNEGHGGHGVQCLGKPTVTLDYYHASLPNIEGKQPHIYDPNLKPDDVFSFISNRLKLGSLDSRFRFAWNEVGDIKTWKAASLKMINDHKILYTLPPDCKLLQAAVREDDVQYGVRATINLLTTGQQELLRAHEALYLLYQKAGGNTSLPVRNLLNVILNLDATDGEIKDATYKFFDLIIVKFACKATCRIYGRSYDKVDLSQSAQFDMQKVGYREPSIILQQMLNECSAIKFAERRFMAQYSDLCPAHLWGQFGCLYEGIVTPETNCTRVK